MRYLAQFHPDVTFIDIFDSTAEVVLAMPPVDVYIRARNTPAQRTGECAERDAVSSTSLTSGSDGYYLELYEQASRIQPS